MVKRKKDGTFALGSSGNPKGPPRLPGDIKSARVLNQIDLARVLNEFVSLPQDRLDEIIQDPSSPTLTVMVAKLVTEQIERGCDKRFDVIMNRLVGKVADKVELKVPRPRVIRAQEMSERVEFKEEDSGDDNEN